MLKFSTTKQFEKGVIKAQKQGKNLAKLHNVMMRLRAEEPLDAKHRNHKLKGNFIGRWECHIEPDWLLIYCKRSDEIIFERIGSHSELFD